MRHTSLVCSGTAARCALRHRLLVAKPSTDTIAVDADNRPFRSASGELLLRPGGHGALIENLSDLGADLVTIKNIDNVATEEQLDETVPWKKPFGGALCLLAFSPR